MLSLSEQPPNIALQPVPAYLSHIDNMLPQPIGQANIADLPNDSESHEDIHTLVPAP
jgi:hypothetical protein